MPNLDPQSKFQARQAKLTLALQIAGLDALVLNPSPSFLYLTGLNFHLMERPVVAVFVPHNPPLVILPELETAKVKALPFPVQSFSYGEDPETWPAVFRQAAQAAHLEGQSRIGVEPRRLRLLELRLLEGAAPEASFISGEEQLDSLRMNKDPDEIAAMRRAVDVAQRALEATLPLIKTGMSERELASELTLQLMRHGSDPEVPFSPIVSSGPNSANPHAAPSNRKLAPGDLLVIDWGANVEGYISDLTRTFAVGEVEAEYRRIAGIVAEANAAGRAAARPGIQAGDVDQAARSVIEAAGYGKYFTHRTGHGIGMEGHEAPYIRAGNPLLLQPGMTFTVEPGIYLPDRNGVRIEDNMVITQEGAESLSDMERSLRTVGGR